MKKIIAVLTIVGSGLFFASCDKTNVTAENAIETVAVTSLANARAASDSLTSSKDSLRHKNHVTVAITALPQVIKDYIAKNYVGFTIIAAHTHTNDTTGKIDVLITNATTSVSKAVQFDAKGVFVAEKAKGIKGQFAHTELAAAAIPASITAYITKNYTGYTVYKAFKDVNNAVHVVIKSDTLGVKVLQFDSANTFVQAKDKKSKGNKG
jgi:hypothetical protein